MGPMLCLSNVALQVGERWIVQRCTLTVPAGLSLVLGGDGAGKTSLLRLLAGELSPDAGQLSLAGAAWGSAGWGQQVFWRDPRAPWPAALTPRAWTAALAGQQPRWREDEWRRHVEGFALAPHLDKDMHQLSTGSQRKVLLAAALASGAALTLIDEPVAALDRGAVRYLCAALQRLADASPWTERIVLVAHYDPLDDSLPWRHMLTLAG